VSRHVLGRELYVISTAELLNDVSDEKKFSKVVAGPLLLVRNATGDGLFTVRPLSWHRGLESGLTLASMGPGP
jgi:cytochrome P450 / NADPH-cytochrome P450 reductase